MIPRFRYYTSVPLGCEGFHIDFVIVTSFSGTNNLEIKTNGDSGDNMYLYVNHNGTDDFRW